MSIRLGAAFPPAALISATTSLAGEVDARSPASVVPRSLATIAAPCAAMALASARPIPPPAPVIAATFPSSFPINFSFPPERAPRLVALQFSFVHDAPRKVMGAGQARAQFDAILAPGAIHRVLSRPAQDLDRMLNDLQLGEFIYERSRRSAIRSASLSMQ